MLKLFKIADYKPKQELKLETQTYGLVILFLILLIIISISIIIFFSTSNTLMFFLIFTTMFLVIIGQNIKKWMIRRIIILPNKVQIDYWLGFFFSSNLYDVTNQLLDVFIQVNEEPVIELGTNQKIFAQFQIEETTQIIDFTDKIESVVNLHLIDSKTIVDKELIRFGQPYLTLPRYSAIDITQNSQGFKVKYNNGSGFRFDWINDTLIYQNQVLTLERVKISDIETIHYEIEHDNISTLKLFIQEKSILSPKQFFYFYANKSRNKHLNYGMLDFVQGTKLLIEKLKKEQRLDFIKFVDLSKKG